MSIRSESIDKLFAAMLNLESVEECYAFFEDLCTVKEIQDMALRFEVAKLLHRGESYQRISEETSISSATISRVNRCLLYGTGGYRAAIEKAQGRRNDD